MEVNLNNKSIAALIGVLTMVLSGEFALGTQLLNSDIQEDESFVGFYLDEKKHLTFRHFDGKNYIPVLDKKKNKYYFLLTTGEKVWCY
jgi:hypothetical protein